MSVPLKVCQQVCVLVSVVRAGRPLRGRLYNLSLMGLSYICVDVTCNVRVNQRVRGRREPGRGLWLMTRAALYAHPLSEQRESKQLDERSKWAPLLLLSFAGFVMYPDLRLIKISRGHRQYCIGNRRVLRSAYIVMQIPLLARCKPNKVSRISCVAGSFYFSKHNSACSYACRKYEYFRQQFSILSLQCSKVESASEWSAGLITLLSLPRNKYGIIRVNKHWKLLDTVFLCSKRISIARRIYLPNKKECTSNMSVRAQNNSVQTNKWTGRNFSRGYKHVKRAGAGGASDDSDVPWNRSENNSIPAGTTAIQSSLIQNFGVRLPIGE